MPLVSTGSSRKFRTDFLQEWPTPGTGPYFDTTVPSNITGLLGKTVHLLCRVKNLGNRTIMPTTCIVVKCGSRSNRDLVRFYAIPSVLNHRFQTHLNKLSKERRDKWLAAIKRDDLTDSKIKYQKVCSRHFISGKPAALEDRNNPDWIPSLNMGYESQLVPKSSSAVLRFERVRKRKLISDSAASLQTEELPTEEQEQETGVEVQTEVTSEFLDKQVSWVRHRDIHLLTVGRYTYTSDQRFEAIHSPHTEEWTLRIRYPQRKDSGIYECQISTTPPIGHPVFLTVVEPVTEIIGGPDLYINEGSTINLTCLVRYAPEPPPTMLWAHNTQVINFDSPRGGISLVTEKGITSSSRLLIQKAVQADTGMYTCSPSNANPTNVRVYILNGEHPAAMYHGIGCILRSSSNSLIFSIILIFMHLQLT